MERTRSYMEIGEIRETFRSHGVSLIFVKKLAKNQDNDKNQIYLGRGLQAVTNIFPANYSVRAKSQSVQKRHSDPNGDILEGRLTFRWIDRDGETHLAPNAKLIEYFQYPEVRLSGFLKGCEWAPAALRRDKQDEFGERILLLGVTVRGETLGLLLTRVEDPIVATWPELPAFAATSLLATLSTEIRPLGKTAVDLLCSDLRKILHGGWHDGRRLKPDGTVVPFTANQAGGYTLEALLDIRSNSAKTPDKYGHEVKAFSGSRISIMTPAPTGGEQGSLPFAKFMALYGWKSKTEGRDSKVFNGQHVFGKTCRSSGATLSIDGYDFKQHKVLNVGNFKVALRIMGSGVDIASWSIETLASSWSEKHAAAVYVPFIAQTGVGTKQVKYGAPTGEGDHAVRRMETT